MKQRYRELTHKICVQAVMECYDGKWHRHDFVDVAGKYGGVTNAEIKRDEAQGAVNSKLEAAEGIALEMEQRLLDLMEGEAEDLDLDPVVERPRVDGMNGKIRDVASCCVLHQCFGHLAFLGLEPLLRARILPFQHASIPGRGQSGCKRQVQRYLRRTSLGIRHAKKLDVKHAYRSTKGEVVMKLLKKEIPSAPWLLALVAALLAVSPHGCLIIGGYLDAWLFNFVMSYVLRYMLSREKVRRGQRQPLVVRLTAYMDDVAIMGRRLADLRSVARTTDSWLAKNFGLHFKPGGDEVTFWAIQREHEHKKMDSPAARGCPGLDLAGFVVHRTYTKIRKKIFKRARRQYLRAASEVAATGTVHLERAYKLAAYAGYFTETDARRCVEHLQADKIKPLACHVIGWAAKTKGAKQDEKRTHYPGSLPAPCGF